MNKLNLILSPIVAVAITVIAPQGLVWAHGDQTGARHLLEDITVDRTASIPKPPEGKVAIRLGHTYVQKPLPGAGITYHETSPEANSLWAMESLEKGEEVPVGIQIKDQVLFLSPGRAIGIAIAYRNPTKRNVQFMVLPHRELPSSAAPDTWLTCLCMSFTYMAPAEGAWYRVVKIKISPDMPVGSRVDVIWPILTDPAVFTTMANE